MLEESSFHLAGVILSDTIPGFLDLGFVKGLDIRLDVIDYKGKSLLFLE